MKNQFMANLLAMIYSLSLVGCIGSTAMNNNDTDYGQLVAVYSAGHDLTKSELQEQFIPNIICSGTISATESNPLTKQEFCELNRLYVKHNPVFGLKDRNINNFVTATNPEITTIKRGQLIYTSPGSPFLSAGGAVAKEIVSGLVLYPQGISESQIKGIVIYYHPTVLSKAGVPSGFGNNTDPVNIFSTQRTQMMLASIYANSGYIVLAPDYIGQGINADIVHPYVLLPQSSALSGIYMLPALKEYLNRQGLDFSKINNGKPNLYISSFSEGGAYALWASYLIQNGYRNILDNLGVTLKRTVGVSGAYDLTHAMLPFAFANINNDPSPESNPFNASPGCDPHANLISSLVCPEEDVAGFRASEQINIATSKPVLGSYMVNALVSYIYTPVAYQLVMVPDFADQKICINPQSLSLTADKYEYVACSALFGKQYTVQDLFQNNGLNSSQIASQLVAASVGSSYKNLFLAGGLENFVATFSAMLNNGSFNSLGSIIYPQLMNDTGVMSFIKAADIYDWKTTSPISLVFLKYDSTVTNINSINACDPNRSSLMSKSQAGLVNCVKDGESIGIDNTNLWNYGEIPLYLSHGNSEGILQLVALHEMESAN